jgi:hypothetical protein
MKNRAIITAANDGYFALLSDLVESWIDCGLAERIDLCVYDVGLTGEQKEWLREKGVAKIEEPGWDFDFPGMNEIPGHYRAMSARPYIPKYFPGYQTYIWVDADAWIQDAGIIDLYARVAEDGKLAIVPEIDRCYRTMYKRPSHWTKLNGSYAWSYGVWAGIKLGKNPQLNVGAFALSADAPHWAAWQERHKTALTKPRLFKKNGLHNGFFFLSEQTAMNYVVYKMKYPVGFLPAYANWICGFQTPAYDKIRQVFTESQPPHQKLGIVHLVGKYEDKVRQLDIPLTSGSTVSGALTYSALRKLRGETLV